MYSILSILFLIGALMIGVGLLGRYGTDGLAEIDANVASAFALIFTYALVFASFSSFSELVPVFDGICEGIPYVNKIAEYGSLKNLFAENPVSAASSFFDAVILSAMIDILSLLPLTRGNATGKFMVKVFTGIVLALFSLFLLNYVVKETSAYKWVVSVIGCMISVVSIGTIPITIISLLKKNSMTGIGIVSVLLLFSQSKVVGILRDSFFKAIVYVFGIWMLEKHFGSVSDGLSQLSTLAVLFGPAFVMIIGVVLILKSIKT